MFDLSEYKTLTEDEIEEIKLFFQNEITPDTILFPENVLQEMPNTPTLNEICGYEVRK